jgi:hypothetical protein
MKISTHDNEHHQNKKRTGHTNDFFLPLPKDDRSPRPLPSALEPELFFDFDPAFGFEPPASFLIFPAVVGSPLDALKDPFFGGFELVVTFRRLGVSAGGGGGEGQGEEGEVDIGESEE